MPKEWEEWIVQQRAKGRRKPWSILYVNIDRLPVDVRFHETVEESERHEDSGHIRIVHVKYTVVREFEHG